LSFSNEELDRYSRQIILPEIGGAGQQKLRLSSVAVVGAGGIGSPVLLYLALSGVGDLTVIDDDRVERSNLGRQILFNEADIGELKAVRAAERLRLANPFISVRPVIDRLTRANAEAILADCDLVIDGSDNFATRDIVQFVCHKLGTPLISASAQKTEGQISCFKPYLGPPNPCYRCAFPVLPAGEEGETNCSTDGIVASVAATVAGLSVTEALKELIGFGRSLSGYLLIVDGHSSIIEQVPFTRNPACLAGCIHIGGPAIL
jgi:molybdopterin/thiamine biosynthesis adenylyltransferase